MAHMEAGSIRNAGYVTLRKGNRKAGVSFLADNGRFTFVFSVTFIFVIFALLFVWTNHESVQVGYSISALQKEQTDLTDANRKLKVELANLTALYRLEKVAKEELGMVTPGPEQLRVIE